MVLDVDLRATLLFACGVWGSYGLSAKDPVEHRLQKPFSTLMRLALGVPASTGHWIASMLMGQLPVQLHIIHLFCSLWNRYIRTAQHNPLIRACLHIQRDLMHLNHGSFWLQHWVQRLRVVLPQSIFQDVHVALCDMQTISLQHIMRSLTQWQHIHLHQAGDPMQHDCPHRRTALVYRHCMLSQLGRAPSWHAWCADDVLPARVWKSWVHFISADSALPVHQLDHLPFAQRICPCATSEVGDEHHLLFRCPLVAHVRQQHGDNICWPAQQSVHIFLERNKFNADLPFCVHDLCTTSAYQLCCHHLQHRS